MDAISSTRLQLGALKGILCSVPPLHSLHILMRENALGIGGAGECLTHLNLLHLLE